MFPFGFASKRRAGGRGDGCGVRDGQGVTVEGKQAARSVFAAPSQRVVAVVSGVEIAFWSGDPSRACAVARWHADESRALVRHLDGCATKAPCSAEWRHDETCVAFLYEKGFLLVLTLHSGQPAGGVGGSPNNDDALAGLPAWASADVTPTSRYHFASAYPRAVSVSSTTYNIDSSKNSGFTPTCLLETADRLLFGGGPAGCLEYMYWNDASIPPRIARALSQDSAFKDLKAHSVEIEGWGVRGGGGGAGVSGDVDDGTDPGSLVEMCAFKGGSRSSTCSMVGYVTSGAVAGMLFLRWDDDKAKNTVIHSKNASTLRFCSTNYRIAVGGIDGKITIYQLLCPQSLRREATAPRQTQGQGQLFGQGQEHPRSMLAAGPTDIEWRVLNVIDIAALVRPSIRWEGGGKSINSEYGRSDGICAVKSLSWSPSGSVIACGARGDTSAATGVAVFVASSGTRLLWHFGSESADLEGRSGSGKSSRDVHTPRCGERSRRLTWQHDVCWVQHGHQLMVHSCPVRVSSGEGGASAVALGGPAVEVTLGCASPSAIPVHSTLNEDKCKDVEPRRNSGSGFQSPSCEERGGAGTTTDDAQSQLVTIPFLSAPALCDTNVHHNTASRRWLQGARHLYRFGATKQAPSRFRWRPLVPPDRYLGANLPIRSFTVSDCDKWLAVAGRRGFTICFLPVLRWSVFGNINHEQCIRVDGLMWWVPGQLLVCVQSDGGSDSSGVGAGTASGGGGGGGSSRGSRSSSRDIIDVDLSANLKGKGVYESKVCFWSVQNGLGESGLLFTLPLDPNWRVHGMCRVGASDTLLVLVALRLPARGFFLYRLLTVEVIVSRATSIGEGAGPRGRGTAGLGADDKATITGISARIVRMVRLPRSSRITTSFCVPVVDRLATGNKASDTLHFAFICLTSEGIVFHFPVVLPLRRRPLVWGVAFVNGNGNLIDIPFDGPVECLWPYTTTSTSTLPSASCDYDHYHVHHSSIAAAAAATMPPSISGSCWAYGKRFGLKMWTPRSVAHGEENFSTSSSAFSPTSTSQPSSSTNDSGAHAQAFGYDGEFTPLGPIPGLGCVVGLCGDPFRASSRSQRGASELATTCFEQRTQLRPCLHAIISAALSESDDCSENMLRARDAARYAARFCPEFAAVGEMVLRGLLEQAYRDRKSIPSAPSSVTLQRALRLLRPLPGYEDAVMRCARKAEQNRWPFLFPVAGTPTALFARSMELGQLHVAASYLMIIANVDMNQAAVSSLSGLPSAATEMQGAVSLRAREEFQSKYASVQEALRLGEELMACAKDRARSDLEAQVRMYLERLAIVAIELQTKLRSM